MITVSHLRCRQNINPRKLPNLLCEQIVCSRLTSRVIIRANSIRRQVSIQPNSRQAKLISLPKKVIAEFLMTIDQESVNPKSSL
jgi:hypothetical protein